MTAGLVFHDVVRRLACLLGPGIVLALAAAACHKEPPKPPPEDEECFGARCVEEAEAAMYYHDYEGAREPLTAVCEKGDAFQCFRLAELYHYGKGGPIDLAMAATIYETSCAGEHGEACERRSDLARDGHGGPAVELDFAVKACTGGRPLGCTRAAEQLNTARGVERDEDQAIELFQKGCRLGEVTGCTGAGDLLLMSPRSTPEAKSRGLTAFINACSGHSADGCLKAAVAFHEGIGTKRDLDKAKSHFTRACEFAEEDGCHMAKLLTEAEGKPVTLELTTAVPEIGREGLEARSVSCRMNEKGLPAVDEVISGVARHKQSLDACVKDGAAVSVTWEFENGRVHEAKTKGRLSKKASKCIAWTLRKAKFSTTGTCQAVLLLGDPDGAARAMAAREARRQAAAGKNRTVRIDADDE